MNKHKNLSPENLIHTDRETKHFHLSLEAGTWDCLNFKADSTFSMLLNYNS